MEKRVLQFGMPEFVRKHLTAEESDILAQCLAVHEVTHLSQALGFRGGPSDIDEEIEVEHGLTLAFQNKAMVPSVISGLYDITKEFVLSRSLDNNPEYVIKLHEVFEKLIYNGDATAALVGGKYLVELPTQFEYPPKKKELLRYLVTERADDVLEDMTETLGDAKAKECFDGWKKHIEELLNETSTTSGTS